jgi:hypothetical protein
MPRLSLWRENHTGDYKFIDRRISEMFTIGGTGILVHKYLGSEGGDGTDATKPAYDSTSIFNIQDLLFLENRDRKYSSDVYTMRGIYQKQDQDYDLSQFGIFLAAGTIFMTFHLNDCMKVVGRKIIPGDVLELQHLRDLWALDDSVPVALKRFYVVQDASFASEGFSPTWWPHLWRVKLQPLVDSQEYKDIFKKMNATSSDPFDPNNIAGNITPLTDVLSVYNKYLGVNQAVIEQAQNEVPQSGYDTSTFYTAPLNDEPKENNLPGNAKGTKIGDPNIKVDGGRYVTTISTAGVVNSDLLFVANANLVPMGSLVSSTGIGNDAGIMAIGFLPDTSLRLSAPVTIANGVAVTFTMPMAKSAKASKINQLKADAGKRVPSQKISGGYLSGTGAGPNGMTVDTGIEFPISAKSGDYFLRLDYVPNRLFRYTGSYWTKIEDAVRTNITPGESVTQRGSFVNNTNTWTSTDGNTKPSLTSLSKALRPDN